MAPIADSRKKMLVEQFGSNHCLTTTSILKAIEADLTDRMTILSTDMAFMLENPMYCYREAQEETGGGAQPPGETQQPGEETEQPVTQFKLEWTGVTKTPYIIKKGENNWFGIEYKNTGDGDWKGYIGIKIKVDGEVKFTYEGDKTKAQTIKAGETKIVWCLVKIPEDLPDGTTSVVFLRYDS